MVDDAAEVPVPDLPVTWRPRNMRIVGYGLAAVIMATMVALAVVLPADWRLADRLGLVALGLVGVGVMHLLARPRLTATETRVTVVNSIRTHVLEWPEIVDARMPVGEPWPSLDLTDGSTLAVMGVQSNDGDLARANLAQFQALLRHRGEAQEPPRPA
ncbi:PH domain-containing protein [Streptomonospora sp. S1-112]|uniref:PH domain-containing protein n=1 Tax=Streptomonospora mangrovi TaxID=2883123 RepID=A0A9X3NL97_9ACTN|nr:PH domain-containing protein [Streptomonospora mangrovi]MDA0565373.1 PH domain-containing protein [Streptomonospora mangrovi]